MRNLLNEQNRWYVYSLAPLLLLLFLFTLLPLLNIFYMSFFHIEWRDGQYDYEFIGLQNYKALPDNLVAQSALGYIRLRLGSVDQAKPAMAGAAQNTGRFPDIDFFVASLLKEMNQNDEAKQVLENALKFEGLFLYRLPAKKLLTELSASELPEPKK